MRAGFAPSTTAPGAPRWQRALVSAATVAVQAIFVVGLTLGLSHESTTEAPPPITVSIFPDEIQEPDPPPLPVKPILQTPQIVLNLPPPPQIYTPPPLVQVDAPPAPITSVTTPPPRIDPSIAVGDFQTRLLRHVNRSLRYPLAARAQRIEGVVLVRFTMDRKGNVSNVAVEKPSGFPLLDEEGIAVLLRAQPFPPPPAELEGDKIDMALPVKFSLRGPGGRHRGARGNGDAGDF